MVFDLAGVGCTVGAAFTSEEVTSMDVYDLGALGVFAGGSLYPTVHDELKKRFKELSLPPPEEAMADFYAVWLLISGGAIYDIVQSRDRE